VTLEDLAGDPDAAAKLEFHHLLRDFSKQRRKLSTDQLVQWSVPYLQPGTLTSYGLLQAQLISSYGTQLLDRTKECAKRYLCDADQSNMTASDLFSGLRDCLASVTKLSQLQERSFFMGMAAHSPLFSRYNTLRYSSSDDIIITVALSPFLVPLDKAGTFANPVQEALEGRAVTCMEVRVEGGAQTRQQLGQLYQAAPSLKWMLEEGRVHIVRFIGRWTCNDDMEQLLGAALAYGVVQLAPTGVVAWQPEAAVTQAAAIFEAQRIAASGGHQGYACVRVADMLFDLDDAMTVRDMQVTNVEVGWLTALLDSMRMWPVQPLDVGCGAGERWHEHGQALLCTCRCH
jgi:hypothetical protein